MDRPSLEERPGYLRLFQQYPGFRRLFLSRVTSLLGDWFNLLAVLALLRETVGSDPRIYAGLLVVKLLPTFLVGPLAGVVADRVHRRTVMIFADIARFIFVLGLLLVPAMPGKIVVLVFGLTGLQIAAAAFGGAAQSACLPNLVPKHALGAANALIAVAWSVMFTLGAALGGVVTDAFGWEVALVVDAATYVVSACFLWGLHLPERPVIRRDQLDLATVTGVRDFSEGLRYIAGRPRVGAVILLKTGWGVTGAITLLLTLFGEQVYAIGGRPDLGVSLLYTARAVGTGIGPVLARALHSDSPPAMRRLLGVCFFWSALWYGGFAWVTHAAAAFLCVAIAHFGGSAIWVDSTVLLQKSVPDEFRGRVFATDMALVTLAIAGSTWIYGELARWPGMELRFLARVMAASLVLPGLAWFAVSARLWRSDDN